MTDLSKFVRFAPRLFYLAAVIVFILSIALPLHEYGRYGHSQSLPNAQGEMRVILVQLILRESINALFLLANGVLFEILIAIWDKIRPINPEAAE